MSYLLLLCLALVVVLCALGGLALVSYRQLRRAADGRAHLERQLYERALAADHRFDHQQRLLDFAGQRQRIAYLESLIEYGVAIGEVPSTALPDLRRFVVDLYEESYATELRRAPTTAGEAD